MLNIVARLYEGFGRQSVWKWLYSSRISLKLWGDKLGSDLISLLNWKFKRRRDSWTADKSFSENVVCALLAAELSIHETTW